MLYGVLGMRLKVYFFVTGAEGELLNFLLRCTPSFSAIFEAVGCPIL